MKPATMLAEQAGCVMPSSRLPADIEMPASRMKRKQQVQLAVESHTNIQHHNRWPNKPIPVLSGVVIS